AAAAIATIATAEIRPAAHYVAHVKELRLRVACRQHRRCRAQQTKPPDHLSSPQINFGRCDETGHNGNAPATNEPVTAAFSSRSVKKDNMPRAMAALPANPLTKRVNNGSSAGQSENEPEKRKGQGRNDERCGKSGADTGRRRRGRLLHQSGH